MIPFVFVFFFLFKTQVVLRAMAMAALSSSSRAAYRLGGVWCSFWRDYQSIAEAGGRRPVEIVQDDVPLDFFDREPEDDDCGPRIPLISTLLEQFGDRSLSSFVDCTVGAAAGHASEIIRAHPELECFVGLDLDPGAIASAKNILASASMNKMLELHLMHLNFKYVKRALHEVNPELCMQGVDGILMDLGPSDVQVNSPERGFDYQLKGPLDMRFDQTDDHIDAAWILNRWPRPKLARFLRTYAGESQWRLAAHVITRVRANHGRFVTTEHLVNMMEKLAAEKKIDKTLRKEGKVGGNARHPAIPIFRALRMAVNDEIDSLRVGLRQAVSCLAPGGRLAVISHIGVEDAIVQESFEAMSKELSTTKNFRDSPLKIVTLFRPFIEGHSTFPRLRVLHKLPEGSGMWWPSH